ncbi:MAG TPA: clan AA aspartic protease [Archaeoglobus sp.]|nr:clan AA aspartic protease [Archaeoglobus sp.]
MFVEGVPVVEVVLSNPLLSTRFPESGSVLAVIDTGYSGFAAVPEDVFRKLKLNELTQQRRSLILPTGKLIESTGSYGRVTVSELKVFRDGFVETASGLDEIVLGTELLQEFRLVLDYCTENLEIHPCR